MVSPIQGMCCVKFAIKDQYSSEIYSRISGTHYLTAQAPAAALMSDDEDDVKKTMLKVAKPDSTQTANTDTGSNNEVAIHEGYAVSV